MNTAFSTSEKKKREKNAKIEWNFLFSNRIAWGVKREWDIRFVLSVQSENLKWKATEMEADQRNEVKFWYPFFCVCVCVALKIDREIEITSIYYLKCCDAFCRRSPFLSVRNICCVHFTFSAWGNTSQCSMLILYCKRTKSAMSSVFWVCVCCVCMWNVNQYDMKKNVYSQKNRYTEVTLIKYFLILQLYFMELYTVYLNWFSFFFDNFTNVSIA